MSSLRRSLGSLRVRVTLSVTFVFALAMAVGAWALVQAVEGSLTDEVQADDRATLESLARSFGSTPADQLTVFVATEPVPVRLVDRRGSVGVGQGYAYPGETTFWAVGAGAASRIDGELGDAFDDDVVVSQLRVETRVGDITLVAATPIERVRNGVRSVQSALLLAVPSLVVLIGMAAWFITGRALHPVAGLTRRVGEITDSTLGERLPVPATDDEIAQLATTMNAMLDRLDEASRRQRQFVSDASHELRSPVAAIRTEVEVALLHPEGVDWAEVARGVLAEDERLAGIVDDLLTLARSDEQKTAPPPLAPAGVVAVVVAEAGRARRHPVVVESPPPLDAVTVGMGADDLTRVVRHLLDNAARHAQSSVRVAVEEGGAGLVRVVVDDDGPGVPPGERERIFERFGRLDEARSRDAGGAGLGLAVVRRLVGRVRGRVWVEDGPLGGARFVVEVPTASLAS